MTPSDDLRGDRPRYDDAQAAREFACLALGLIVGFIGGGMLVVSAFI